MAARLHRNGELRTARIWIPLPVPERDVSNRSPTAAISIKQPCAWRLAGSEI